MSDVSGASAVLAIGTDLASRLRAAGVDDVVGVAGAADSVFDENTHSWQIDSDTGTRHRARIVVTSRLDRTDAMRPYLDVAVHGLPNFFVASDDAQLRYVVDCLATMRRSGDTRIEVRYSSQFRFDTWRGPVDWNRMRVKIRDAFDLSSHTGVEPEVYDDTASLRIGDDERQVRVRLAGHLDPIDGRYHWQGTVFADLPAEVFGKPAQLTIGERTAPARVTERTPSGSCSIVGVGTPPFTLDPAPTAP